MPEFGNRVDSLQSLDEVRHLDVRLNRLNRWHVDGLLCIGDAAHAMSPVGGVGINLAIQDAVAAANILWQGDFAPRTLKTLQDRREFPTRVTQQFQLLVQERILSRVLAGDADAAHPPLVLRLLSRFALLRQIPARIVGVGVRPEHVHSPAVTA
jgi:2-polyprenyl-6-methoxyphenol hydroxylase-like FAD-dependent oxidoreductase